MRSSASKDTKATIPPSGEPVSRRWWEKLVEASAYIGHLLNGLQQRKWHTSWNGDLWLSSVMETCYEMSQ